MESAFLSESSSADPLSDVLSLVRPRGYMTGAIDAGGKWALGFDSDGMFRCFALVSGQCWLVMDGLEVLLEAGDFVVLPHGREFRVASAPSVAPVDIMSVVREPLNGRILTWQGGGACLALAAIFTFSGPHADVLLGVLPPIVHIRNHEDRAAMRWYLERMMALAREPQPGGLLLGEHLAQMMLIEVLRRHLADRGTADTGWLFALADQQMSAALTAIHQAPGQRWTLQQLAERSGLSRSAFALRFKQTVGASAIEYLTRWRMLLAADRLASSGDTVSNIAFGLGYESESAFSFAFKREMGCSPRQYGRTRAES